MRIHRFLSLALSLLLLACQPQGRYDLLITNVRVVDGTGNPWYTADVGVRGDRIVDIGMLSDVSAVRRIDGNGRVLAPGFIDMLGQSDLSLLVDNRAMSKISQGVTTEITGEGESAAPQNERTKRDLEAYERRHGVKIDWTDFEGYFRALEAKKHSINIGTFVGATQVRAAVVGYDDRDATDAELQQMKDMVDLAMRQGALGVSTALEYAPAAYAPVQELIELSKIAAAHGGIYITHIRDERDHIIEALYEASDVARGARIPAHIWHLKVAGKQNWGRMSEVTRLISRFRSEGLDVTADVYPYTASGTSLSAAVPAWVHDGGTEKFLERIKDPSVRIRIKGELEGTTKGAVNFYRGTGPEGIMIASIGNPELKNLEGLMLSAIANGWKKPPVDALLDLLIADSARTGAIYFAMNEQDVRMAIAQPWTGFNTDARGIAIDGPFSTSKPHPRAYGSFARILAKYVRQDNVLSLEDAIRKMTSLAAQRFGLDSRGLVKPGFYADLVLFDPAKVVDKATFENPHQYSEGMDVVMVNGQPVWENGAFTGNLPGRILKGAGAQK